GGGGAGRRGAALEQLELAGGARCGQSLRAGVAAAVTVTRNVTAQRNVSPPALFFTDAEAKPGYVPRPPRSERERIEGEIRALRQHLWSSPEDKNEILGRVEALEAELRALGGNR